LAGVYVFNPKQLGHQIVDGIFVQDNISNMAHIVGGVVGAVLGYGLNKKKKYIKNSSD